MDIERIARLTDFDTPTVANGLEKLHLVDPAAGYTGPDVRALTPEMGRRVGVAVTARLDTTTPRQSVPCNLFKDWIRLMVEAYRRYDGQLPVFAVMEAVGLRPRYTVTIGDGMGTTMKLAGCAGFLTNASIRDIEGLYAVPLACWGAGLSPMHGAMHWLDVGSPVVIDGMTVNNGDIIHADINGALVIPPDCADQVYAKAEEVSEFETRYFAWLRQPGMTIEDYLNSR